MRHRAQELTAADRFAREPRRKWPRGEPRAPSAGARQASRQGGFWLAASRVRPNAWATASSEARRGCDRPSRLVPGGPPKIAAEAPWPGR